jgi:hypothetical protein
MLQSPKAESISRSVIFTRATLASAPSQGWFSVYVPTSGKSAERAEKAITSVRRPANLTALPNTFTSDTRKTFHAAIYPIIGKRQTANPMLRPFASDVLTATSRFTDE